MSNNAPIGIFDSGVGGLTVLSSVRALLPQESFIYIFDKSHAPYGNRSEAYIRRRVDVVCAHLIRRGVKAIVVACNTATNVGIAELRKRFSLPFVGVEPPVKPAALSVAAGKILVLTTVATARQKKFTELLSRWNDGRFVVAPQPTLAALIEDNFHNLAAIRGEVRAALSGYDDVGGVVLGCTHYAFVADMIAELFPAAQIFDGSAGAARRLHFLLGEGELLADPHREGGVEYIYL